MRKADKDCRCAICGGNTRDLFEYYTAASTSGNTSQHGEFYNRTTTTTRTYSDVRRGEEPVCKRCRRISPKVRLITFVIMAGTVLIGVFLEDWVVSIPALVEILSAVCFVSFIASLIMMLPKDGSDAIVSYLKRENPRGIYLTDSQVSRMQCIRR